jgi:hypothetical protein
MILKKHISRITHPKQTTNIKIHNSMKVIMDILAHSNNMNTFMHLADVFEGFKQLADYQAIEVKGTDAMKVDQLTENMKNSLEQAGMNVVFVGIKLIDGILTDKYPPYIKKGVSQISFGNEWGMFTDILEQIDWIATTDENMQVISATVKMS